MNRMKGGFNAALVESIGEGLAMVLGIEGAKSVTFYIDPHIAVADPDIYAESVTKLLQTGTGLLFPAILEILSRNAGIPKVQAETFGDGVREIRRKLH